MSVEFEKWKSQKNWFEKDRTHVDPHDSSHTCRFTCVTRYLFTSRVVMPNFSWYLDYIFLTSTWGLWSFRSHPLIWAWLRELNASAYDQHKVQGWQFLDHSETTLNQLWVDHGSSWRKESSGLLGWLVGQVSTGPWPKAPPSKNQQSSTQPTLTGMVARKGKTDLWHQRRQPMSPERNSDVGSSGAIDRHSSPQ